MASSEREQVLTEVEMSAVFWFLIRLLIELWLFLFRMSYQSLVALLERKYEISSIAKCDMSRFIHVTICW
ncbi:hypothetical protein [Vibrio diabolicus]|uniref:Uncharacterized protein n=1 Tax=Vibrio diabolicus TaxID=50719 RepID=A0AAX1XTC2_9VIBR|nr:hypothetical protein [Vibrio diabolicus]MCS0347196.1 hypothetical protein [Vibrio diabolicus]MCS0359300.1 hypothetical protein [Vibrio diabolicus]MCS0373851.1 hypothetical protein [Vibrio diabolicus]MCS0428931.1 hypothetical protein [Vibrio diabolicus]MCS0439655.1 hypothetical protein [Vibrio diabolicus]